MALLPAGGVPGEVSCAVQKANSTPESGHYAKGPPHEQTVLQYRHPAALLETALHFNQVMVYVFSVPVQQCWTPLTPSARVEVAVRSAIWSDLVMALSAERMCKCS